MQKEIFPLTKNTTQIIRYEFHINGMHCKSCTVVTEDELKKIDRVERANANLSTKKIWIEGALEDKQPSDLVKEINQLLNPRGYAVSLEKIPETTATYKNRELAESFGYFILLCFLAWLVWQAGITDRLQINEMGYGAAFLIGAVASVSTCMAMVGGLVLSLSATFSKFGDRFRPQALFHIGRLVSFFILGGTIGMLGSTVHINQSGTAFLNIAVGLIMFILGINLLSIFDFAKKWQISMPKIFSSKALHLSKNGQHWLAPVLLGVITFFLPCGFTQSVQVYALSTGDFWKGAFTMLSFALGTFPVLALLSFGTSGISEKKPSGVLFKTAGFVVLVFAIVNIWGGLSALGLIEPLFTLTTR